MQSRERFQKPWRRVNNGPDRPLVEPDSITARYQSRDGHIVQIRLEGVVYPLTPIQVVRGKTIGGGTSKEALRRAKRKLAANGHS